MKARIHWNKQQRCWTIHTYKRCIWTKVAWVQGWWETELKPENRSNPRGFILCDTSQITTYDDDRYLGLRMPEGTEQLLYDKEAVQFNVNRGYGLWITPHGIYVPPQIPLTTDFPVVLSP